MPAIRWDIHVQAGSYDPEYILISDPDTRTPVDLTAPGWEVTCVVASRSDGAGAELLRLPDGPGSVWQRSPDGRLIFAPSSQVSAGWPATARRAHHQVELAHPSGQTVRVAQGRFRVDPELVT